LVAIAPLVNAGFFGLGGDTVFVRLTTVRVTRRGVALDVLFAAFLAGADLVVLVRLLLVVARPLDELRPLDVERRELVELERLELERLDERPRELDELRPPLERPLDARPPRPPRRAILAPYNFDCDDNAEP